MAITVTEVNALDKRKVRLHLDNGQSLILYKGELRKLSLKEGSSLSEEQYELLLKEIIGKRATKRAMHLLEKQDRTEHQLYDKLRQSGYPEECISQAIAYVKSYHYIDDLRYSQTYIRYHQEKKSRQRLKSDLMAKGVRKELIDQALEEEFASDERQMIHTLLEKRRYDSATSDEKEKRKTYQFLLRRGFRSSDILATMHMDGSMTDE